MAGGDCADRAERRFDGGTPSVSRARQFVTETLKSWDAADLVWSAALLTTELAANAVIHAATGYRVELSYQLGQLRIAVSDGSERHPRTRHYGTEATTGRGLALVESLSTEWGFSEQLGGKTVWCVVRPDEPAGDDVEPDLDDFLDDADRDLSGPSTELSGGTPNTHGTTSRLLGKAAA